MAIDFTHGKAQAPTDRQLAKSIPLRVSGGTVTVPQAVAALGTREIYDMVVNGLSKAQSVTKP